MDKGLWVVEGIQIEVADSLHQEWLEYGNLVKFLFLDVSVENDNKYALMQLLQVNLKEKDYLTFTNGHKMVEGKLVEALYSEKAEGYSMRLTLELKGNERRIPTHDHNLKVEADVKKVEDIQEYLSDLGQTLNEKRAFYMNS